MGILRLALVFPVAFAVSPQILAQRGASDARQRDLSAKLTSDLNRMGNFV